MTWISQIDIAYGKQSGRKYIKYCGSWKSEILLKNVEDEMWDEYMDGFDHKNYGNLERTLGMYNINRW